MRAADVVSTVGFLDAIMELTLDDGTVIQGYVQGNGGVLRADAARRMRVEIERANDGLPPLHLFEPAPFCIAVTVNQSRPSESRITVDLRRVVKVRHVNAIRVLTPETERTLKTATDWIAIARPELLPRIANGETAAIEEGLRSFAEASVDFFAKAINTVAAHPQRKDLMVHALANAVWDRVRAEEVQA